MTTSAELPVTHTGQDPAVLQTGDATPGVTRSNQFAEGAILGILFAIPALFCMQMAVVADPDIWWHLRTGQWILQHHSLPHTDPFSSFGAGKPWATYSWLYELVVFKCFQRFGLAGILAYSTGMVLAITAAIYHLLRRLQPDFSICALLTLVAASSLMRLFTPRPWLFTILFFALELDILMYARRTGRRRELLWLPLIFALWANVHIQFIDGLVIMGLAFGEALAARWWPSTRTRLSLEWIGGAFAASLLATLASPFTWHIYQIAYDMVTHSGIGYVSEMGSLAFRTLADYGVLFLALAAAGALAWRRRFPLFETALLAFAAYMSFHSGRDMWIMAIVAAAILAPGIGGDEKTRRPFALFSIPVTAAIVGVILFLASAIMGITNDHLHNSLAKDMPVRAVEVVKDKGFPGPLYNNFDWGGYLIWNLRMPVSIDGRTDVIGKKRLARSVATWNGGTDWASDPDLRAAKLVIGPVNAPLTQLLRLDQNFSLVFEDKVAAVFIARSSPEKSNPQLGKAQ